LDKRNTNPDPAARKRPRRTASQRIVDAGARVAAIAPPRLRPMAVRGPQRRLVLRQIFRLMVRQLDPSKANAVDAVIHWQIVGPKDRWIERWQVVIKDGRASATRTFDRKPTLTIKLSADRFIEIVSGVASAPALYMSGGLSLDGDLMLAARMPSLFRIPQPRARRAQ
jgi:putative sterol carrier protein